MIYPFVSRSLTQAIDKKIHHAIRSFAPVKYCTFVITAYLERAGFAIGVLAFFVYFVAYSAVRTTGHLESPEFAEVVDVLAKVVVASTGVSITCSIVQAILFRELEPLAQQALRRIANETN